MEQFKLKMTKEEFDSLTEDQKLVQLQYSKFEETRLELIKRVKSDLIAPQPLLTLNGVPVLYENSILVVQGKTGSFKSRFTQQLIASLVEKGDCVNSDILKLNVFTRDHEIFLTDTERNLQYQYPAALQHTITTACGDVNKDIERLSFGSLLNIDRGQRLNVIEKYIEERYISNSKRAIIVIDVFSDLILDINNNKQSTQLIDYINILANKHNCSFIVVMHENPGKENYKIRGHLGTELFHKCSTCIQLVKAKGQDDYCIINFLKVRDGRSGSDMIAQFDSNSQLLRLVTDESRRREVLQSFKFEKASPELIGKFIIKTTTQKTAQSSLIPLITSEFGLGKSTAEKRLESVRDKVYEVDGVSYKIAYSKEGNRNFFEVIHQS